MAMKIPEEYFAAVKRESGPVKKILGGVRKPPRGVGASLMDWATKHRLATTLGMKSAEFTGKQLNRLGIQREKVKHCTKVYAIPVIPDG